MVWDSEGISESQDTVLEEIFESVDAGESDSGDSDKESSHGKKKKGKKVKKEKKSKKRSRSGSSSSVSVIDPSSSQATVLIVPTTCHRVVPS